MLGFIATAYGQAEQWGEGLRRVDEGIELGEVSHERVYAAELWRVKGELLVGKAGVGKGRRGATAGRAVGAAQQCFRRALEIAEKQEARSLALRSAMSLTRLARRHGGAQEAYALLRSLDASFAEGFDTRDLKEAKALLNGVGA
jgi:adenylate cyclase